MRFAMRSAGITPIVLALAFTGALAAYTVPHGLDARAQLTIIDDPARIAERVLDEKFDAALAEREIIQALAANDADLAKSFVDLAQARHVALDPALIEKVHVAVKAEDSTEHTATSFAKGFVTGVPTDLAGLAGTTLGDLFVFGDVRDAVREGTHLAMGEKADTLILGLACVGLAITAGTYATLGTEAPARLGLSMAKAARRTGRLSVELANSVARMMRGVVDGGGLKRAAAEASLLRPVVAVRAARDAVKVERAGGLLRLAGDVGRIDSKAGTRAALDSLQIAESPREVSRLAKLAEKEGGRTRAILKVAGRSAIVLTSAVFDLAMWIVGALMALFGFVSSLKSATERVALRVIRDRKARRMRTEQQTLAALAATHC